MTLKSTLVLLTLLVGTTQAATLNVISLDSARGRDVSMRIDGVNSTVYAGVIVGSYDGSQSFDLLCVDFFTSIDYGLYDSYDRLPLLNGREDRAAWLFANVYKRTTINTTNLGAAFQIAIWDIIHDGGDGPSAGRIRSNSSTPSAVITSWNSFLTQSLNRSSLEAVIYVNSQGLIPAQNLIGLPVSEQPEPSTYAVLGTGLLTLAWLRRSKAKS